MKRIFLLIGAIALTTLGMAQCVPGTKTAPGKGYIIPDSATNMVHACAGTPYEEIFYIKAFKDTVIAVVTGKTDSIIINLDPVAMGLPSYLSLSSVPAALAANDSNNFPHLLLKGDSLACVKVSGTVPAGTTAGTTNLSINFKAYLQMFLGAIPLGDTMLAATYNDYKFVVDPSGTGVCAVTINEINKNLTSFQAIPNPAQNQVAIQFTTNEVENLNITLQTISGQVLMNQNTKANKGINYIPFNVANLANGFYFYTITNDNGAKVSGRFVKN